MASASSVNVFIGSLTIPSPALGQTLNCAPAAADTMTNAVSHLCGFADTTNSGLPTGTTLKRVPQDITAPDATTGSGWTYNVANSALNAPAGSVVTNIECTCGIDVVGDNVTIKNSKIRTGGLASFAIALRHSNDTIVQDNLIAGIEQYGGQRCDGAVRDIYGDAVNITVRRNEVYWCSSPMNNIANGGLIEQNYFHDFGYDTTTAGTAGEDHLNGIQFEPGTGALMTAKNNTILNQWTQTDAIMLANDGGGTENNRIIDHNLIGGAGYTFYGSGGPTQLATNIRFQNNSFSRVFFLNGGNLGPSTYWVSGGSGNLWSGNVWDDTGSVVSAG